MLLSCKHTLTSQRLQEVVCYIIVFGNLDSQSILIFGLFELYVHNDYVQKLAVATEGLSLNGCRRSLFA